MKKLLLIVLLLPLIIYGQQVINNKQGVLPKKLNDNLYEFYDIPIMVENGHGEKVKVLFSAKISIYVWKDLVKKYSGNERKAFVYLAETLSVKAQYSLKNVLSFDPLKKEFFMSNGNYFESNYHMMGRNDYGNLGETSALVACYPFEAEDYKKPAIDTSSTRPRLPGLNVSEKDLHPMPN